mgnify:CR=1 FL=1
MKNRKGISPLIATVLLVAISLTAFIFIFTWSKGFIKEPVEKFNENIDNSCQSLAFDSSLNGNVININNNGNVPIYGLNVEVSAGGRSFVKFLRSNDGLIGSGESDSIDTDLEISDDMEISITPVLLGTGKESGKSKLYPCEGNKIKLK